VSDRQWSSVKIGDLAKIVVDAYPDQKFEGVVERKWETADPQTGVFTIELVVKNQHRAKLANGMFGTAELSSDTHETTWSLPYEAVLDANDNEGFVFVTNDDKTAIKQPVVIESFDGNTIRISKGLESSKALIVSGSAYLTDRSPITILK
jgi:multidrug efflux pump subunit AcrA (membrane-fusion protein)